MRTREEGGMEVGAVNTREGKKTVEGKKTMEGVVG